ncbi:hypothetical protein HYZ41_04890 [archaeon]|nr:hypothetical protein [archaeon]
MDNKTPSSNKKIYMIVTAIVMVSIIFYFFTTMNMQSTTVTNKMDVKTDVGQVTIKQNIEQQTTVGPKKFGTVTVNPGGISQADITISGSK